MQPNGNVPGAGRPVAGAPMNNVNAKPAPVPTPPPTPAPKLAEPAFGNGGSVVEGKGGKKTGWILAVVFLLIVAAGGIGFGVWAWMDGNAQKDALNEQINTLKRQNNDLQEQLGSGEIVVDTENVNPIITSSDSGEEYSIYFDSSNVYGVSDANIVNIGIKDGTISSCELGKRVYESNQEGYNTYGTTKIKDCNITGISGEIYKVVEFGAGQDNSDSNIGFILTDGTVDYLPLYESVRDDNFAIRGKVGVGGDVVDIFSVGVDPTTSPVGGYMSSVFVLNDGTFVKFNEAMLN